MLHQSAIEGYFAQQEDLLVEAVSRLVRIDSTLGPAQPGQPFGPGPAAALEAFLSLAQEWGLPGENLSGYVGTVDLNNQPDTALHILGHLDIVDAGEGWTVTAPFQPKVVDGLLYGRGTADDKGPMVAALLAVKAVRDLKLPLTKNVRLIAGTDEETGFRDIKWYYGSHPYAPHTLSPDADFPIINLEKGHYQPTFQADWPQAAALPLADCPSTRAIRALHALFPHGDHRGTALGIAQADDLSGPLTLAFTMLTLNDTGCTGRFDSRTPLTATQASVQTVAEAALRAAGFAVQGDMDPPHYVPESDPFLRTLAQCYEAYTGQKGQCLAIGGGTYVHDIPGGVAFGPNMPGFVSNLHGPDEKIRVTDLLTTAKIYAQVMVALCL